MDKVVKHFCRLITDVELDDDDVIEFYDIVQSVASTKLVTAYSDGDKVSVEITSYTTEDNSFLYEIILNGQLNLDEGEEISDLLDEEFDFDFEFETSLEV